MTKTRKNLSTWLSEQRRLPYRFRKSVVKRMYPKLLKDHPFEMEFFGMKYCGNTANNIDRVAYFCGAYEKYMLFFLRDMVAKMQRDSLVFWDIGANVGNHALFMSRLVKEVHAFEPFEKVRTQMEHNVQVNGIKNITIHPVGLGNANARLPFYAPPPGIQGNGSFVEGGNAGNSYYTELQVAVGDELVGQGVPAPHIVKLDVEGFECQVLEGMKATIRATRPLIIFELLPKTREQFAEAGGMEASFPPEYSFFGFTRAGRERGDYTLEPFDAEAVYKRKDVVACPKEMLEYVQ